jgi:hypothetical protein
VAARDAQSAGIAGETEAIGGPSDEHNLGGGGTGTASAPGGGLAKLHRMLRFCGLLTLALNTAGALSHREYGTALVDAVGPALLMLWSEVGPWTLRQIHAACPTAAPRQLHPKPQTTGTWLAVLPPGLLARTRELDAAHRTATGKPISRDKLRAQLRIGRDQASALVTAVRADAQQSAREGTLPHAA